MLYGFKGCCPRAFWTEREACRVVAREVDMGPSDKYLSTQVLMYLSDKEPTTWELFACRPGTEKKESARIILAINSSFNCLPSITGLHHAQPDPSRWELKPKCRQSTRKINRTHDSFSFSHMSLHVADEDASAGGIRRTLTSGRSPPSNARTMQAGLLQRSQLSQSFFQSIARFI